MEHTAFKIWPVIDRRRQDGGPVQPIRSVAVDQGGSKLYLGLEDGLLEEHTLVKKAGTVAASLSARKHVSKKRILAVAPLGAAANCLAVLTNDGSVHLLEYDTLKAQLLPFRNVVTTCADTRPGQPARLALALKPSRRALRIEVYQVTSGSQPWGRPAPLAFADVLDPSAVKAMAWVGPSLVVAAGLRYLLVTPSQQGGQWRELFAVPEDLAYSPAMVRAIPQLARALLTVGPAGILVDGSGSPAGSALRLDGLATPRALAASGPYLLAACEDAIHVFDCAEGGEVQVLEYGAGLRPLPGQLMFGADNPSGSCVLLAGRAVVWACLPVSSEEQAREVLRRRDYGRALALIEQGLAQGEGWAEVASAQAALCLLHDCLFELAGEALERCSPAVFQPAQLFPLFPHHTQGWLGQAPPQQRYWGLAPPLQSLDALIARRLAATSAAPSPAGSLASSRSSSLRSPVTSPSPAASLSLKGWANGSQQQHQQQQHRKATYSQLEGGSEEGGQHGQQGEQLRQAAWESLVHYLFRVRMMEGVACPEGVDTLLLLLLVDRGAVREATAFLSIPNKADTKAAAEALQAQGWRHALATLWAARGDAECALHIWRQLVEGALAGQQDPGLHAAERQEALESAAELLRDPRACPDATVPGSLAWLLPASPAVALSVLTARPLDPHAVLAALSRDSDVRWQYLDHLVGCMAAAAAQESNSNGSSTAGATAKASSVGSRSRPPSASLHQRPTTPLPPAAAAGAAAAAGGRLSPQWVALVKGLSPETRSLIHTELATQLTAAILREQPSLRSPQPASHRKPPPRSLGRGLAGTVGKALAGVAGTAGRSSSSSSLAEAAVGGVSAGGGGSSRRGSHAHAHSTAALVSRGVTEEESAAPVWRLRLRLRQHLEGCGEYDRAAVLRAVGGTGLHEELVVLHCQMGDHLSALRLLALTLRDIAAAEAYAIAHLPPAEYRTLLQLVLHPGPGVEPLYEDACYLVTALGSHLDPLDIVQALPASMPLATAATIVAPILRDRVHRRRQGAVLKNLHRAQLNAARGQKADAEGARLVVDDERACPGCHLRIGGKVFVVLQQAQQGGTAGKQQQQGLAGGGAAAAGLGGVLGAAVGAGQQAKQAAGPAAGQEVQVVCYNCYRRMSGKVSLATPGDGHSRTYSGMLDML
ncbi:hypothetical protein N2152v2_005942 [Parachlorella kessleri]